MGVAAVPSSPHISVSFLIARAADFAPAPPPIHSTWYSWAIAFASHQGMQVGRNELRKGSLGLRNVAPKEALKMVLDLDRDASCRL